MNLRNNNHKDDFQNLNLEIKSIQKCDLDMIRNMDKECFNRSETKTLESIEFIYKRSINNSYLLCLGDIAIGYAFTHDVGDMCILGPIGILTEYQGRGFGILFLNEIMIDLEATFKSIGLEVLPTNHPAITLYLRCGFQLAYPTIQILMPTNKEYSTKHILDLEQLSNSGLSDFYLKVNTIGNMKFTNELKLFIDHKSDIAVFYNEGSVSGFLCYNKKYCDFCWGALASKQNSLNIFLELYYYLQRKTNNSQINVRINTGDH